MSEERKKASPSSSSIYQSQKMDWEERSDAEDSVKGTKKTDKKEGKEKGRGRDHAIDSVNAVEMPGDRVAVLEPRTGTGARRD